MIRETLILFTRFPDAGRVKTRLIPQLGSDGAAQLHREMTEYALSRIWPLVRRRGMRLEVRFEGGPKAQMRRWLGNELTFTPQGNGDLGERMLRASNDAFSAGADAVVIIGADCPELNAALIKRGFDSLRANPLVFGPAKDGGYYLVGLNVAMPAVFESIPWSTSEVLTKSIARARQRGVEPFLLPELSDVDEAADLEVWEKARRASRYVSVIIPTLNEAEQLPLTLKRAATVQSAEIIIADGGSHDDTLAIARIHGAKVVHCAMHRARQMNTAAKVASGGTLLFLHADTWLPENWHEAVFAAFCQPNVVGGAFRFSVRDPFRGRRLVEHTTNLRSRLWRMPYGDQALFVRRWAFEELGGFPDLPIMEDYEFVRRLRRLGTLALLDSAVLISGRRWKRLGMLRTTLINKFVILGYRCGMSPAKLARFYRAHNARPLSASAMPTTNPGAVCTDEPV